MVKVRVFSTSTCPYCKMEKEFLERNNIPFESVFVESDPHSYAELLERTKQTGVPVTEISFADERKEYVIGYNEKRLAEIFGVQLNL